MYGKIYRSLIFDLSSFESAVILTHNSKIMQTNTLKDKRFRVLRNILL